MGYRGFVEVVCRTGHYECREHTGYEEGTDPFRDRCKVCQAQIGVIHKIDATNGIDETDPACCPAPKTEVSFTDTWHKDHYGNRYAIKHPTYTVDLKYWYLAAGY